MDDVVPLETLISIPTCRDYPPIAILPMKDQFLADKARSSQASHALNQRIGINMPISPIPVYCRLLPVYLASTQV